MFSLTAVFTGVVVHPLFWAVGLPPAEVGDVRKLATFAIDYTFWLNLVSIASPAPSSRSGTAASLHMQAADDVAHACVHQ